MELPMWLLVALVVVAVATPFVYVLITWEHEITASYAALPAPSDLGTKEFLWRCYLSPMTRRGWRSAILRAPCPRITLQSRFALLSTDFAKLTTSLGFQELQLETIPFIFPQIAASGLFVQLLGNSHFPAALGGIKTKAITICQLRPLDMRFRDKAPEPTPSDSPEHDGDIDGLHCLMVLTEKRFLETEIEFLVQTDLFDEQGTVWQSTTCFSVPFTQKTLLAPLSVSAAQLDAKVVEGREFLDAQSTEFACTPRNLDELENVSVANLDGTTTNRSLTPLMWLVGRTAAALQHQKRVPTLPILCSMVLSDEAAAVPIQARVKCESTVSDATKPNDKPIMKVRVTHGSTEVISGVLRTVGWVYEPEAIPSGASGSS